MQKHYFPDLHTHTTASDGVFTPSQVVFRAKEHGVSLLAISDHDSINGLPEAAEAAVSVGITLIPAVEISAGDDGNTHVLGYGVSASSTVLKRLFSEMALEREERAQEMLRRLCVLGMPIAMEDVPAARGAVKGRPQIARALVQKGYVETAQEAFERFIGNGRPAYVPRRKRPVADIVGLLRQENVIPVLAHPALMRLEIRDAEACILQWREAGLLGVEVYHPSHAPDAFAPWDTLARANGLLVTGGSDFHELGDKHADIGDMIAYWSMRDQDAAALLACLEETRKHA